MVKTIFISAIALMMLAIVAIVLYVGGRHLLKDHQEKIGSTVMYGSLLILFGFMGSGAALKVFVVNTGISLGIPGLNG